MQDAIFHFDTHHSFDTILDTDLVTPSVPNQLFPFWKQPLQFGGQRPPNLQNRVQVYSNQLSQIFELKSQNPNLNSLLCEISHIWHLRFGNRKFNRSLIYKLSQQNRLHNQYLFPYLHIDGTAIFERFSLAKQLSLF